MGINAFRVDFFTPVKTALPCEEVKLLIPLFWCLFTPSILGLELQTLPIDAYKSLHLDLRKNTAFTSICSRCKFSYATIRVLEFR